MSRGSTGRAPSAEEPRAHLLPARRLERGASPGLQRPEAAAASCPAQARPLPLQAHPGPAQWARLLSGLPLIHHTVCQSTCPKRTPGNSLTMH